MFKVTGVSGGHWGRRAVTFVHGSPHQAIHDDFTSPVLLGEMKNIPKKM
jgi:hypothetical protein